MKTNKLIFLVLLSSSAIAQSSLQNFYARNDFLLASSGSLKSGLWGYDNPALLNYQHQFDLSFMWSNDVQGLGGVIDRYGVFTAGPNFGFSAVHESHDRTSVTNYRASFGVGNRMVGVGFSYGWTPGDFFERPDVYAIGTLFRPLPHVSVGAVWTSSIDGDDYELTADIGLRPFGNELLTIFADYNWRANNPFPVLPFYGTARWIALEVPRWSAGAVLEPLPGVRLTGRYFENNALTVGLQLSLGNVGLSTQAHYDNDGNYSHMTYGVRVGAYDRTMVRKTIDRNKKYLELNLQGPIDYQRYRFFDNRKTLSDLLNAIDAAKTDPSVGGIAINTSAMMATTELLYELREKLKEFRATSKRVIVFIDRVTFPQYYFASVADKIVLDPYGELSIQGVVAGRTFLKGTFEKIGIGVDELRFFKYKSAAETFSREKMSDADREQRQALIDDIYTHWRNEICRSRNLTPERFDEIVNRDIVVLPKEAIMYGLADTIARWEGVKEMIKTLDGSEKGYITADRLERPNLPPDNFWGEKPQIAVIYALGVCAMDEGINARKLVKDVQAAVENPSVKAIVLRVDSPGGDPMASDYIALALKKAKGKKPIIVSQGNVAASGGYWLSMYADTIIAAPTTVTGSIGVIGTWLYNNGLKESLGLSTDFVKVGEHADLGFGFGLPLIGAIPDRGFTPEERSRVEASIRTLYTDFVGKVAEGRKKKPEEIEPIAQGRVWSGIDGMQNGLVDGLGTLETAIMIAKAKAGLADNEVTLVEYPRLGLFNPMAFVPRLIGIEAPPEKDQTLDLIKFHLRHNGKPMPILPLEDLMMMEIPKQ
ncbi:MAG TPA: signal peptide peptidase SppA [Bacteroidota bacterium]|nr:signal peptide peptidase SppA [Bacteroidota bacterium]